MKKRFLSILVTAAMLLSLLPMAAFAEGEAGALQTAINGASNGDTIALEGDVTESITIPQDKTIILDLAGHKLTNEEGKHTITVALGGALTVIDTSKGLKGTVDNVSHARSAVYNNGTVVLKGGSYLRSAENGKSEENSGGNSYYNILNHGVMTIDAPVKVSQSGGYSSMLVNGYYNYNGEANKEKNPHSNYIEGTNQPEPTLTINGGTFDGGLNTIKNDDGGVVTINGGTFKNIKQHAVFNVNKATINGGSFATQTGAKSILYNRKVDDNKDVGQLTVAGGVFTTTPTMMVASSNDTKIIGGVFADDVSAYLPDTHEAVDVGGQYAIAVKSGGTAEVGGHQYETLANALTVAKWTSGNSGATTVTLLKNSTGAGVQFPAPRGTESYVIDLGGYIYTVTKPTVGSYGTETNAFQMIKGNNITFKNGTLKAGEGVEILLQNYCNLTLDGVTVDCRGSKSAYALSNNHGNITIKGATNIYAKEGGVAFDLWYGMSETYKDGITVTVDETMTGTIQGKIEYGGKNLNQSWADGWQSKTKLIIKAGNFKGDIVASSSNALDGATIKISGGYFSSDPSAYLVEGKAALVSDKSGYNFMVGEKKMEVIPAPPAVDNPVKDDTNKSDDEKNLAGSLETALKATDSDKAPSVSKDVITAAANTAAEKSNVTTAEEVIVNGEKKTAEAAVQALNGNNSDTQVVIVVQPYLDIKIKDVKIEGAPGSEAKTLTLDITPKAKTVATAKTVAEANNPVIKTDGDTPNAVFIEEEELPITQPVEVKIPLPADFVTKNGDGSYPNIYINHVKGGRTYTYTAEVSEVSSALFATFTNPHGFSEFTLTTTNNAVAEVDGVGYATLQDAVDAVANNGTIKILKADETATASRTVKFTVDPNSLTYTINLGSRCTNKSTTEHVFDVVYTPSSGGGSSSRTYAVTVEKSKNGSVTASSKNAASGKTVTLTVKPDEGYMLDELTVTDAKGKDVKLTKKSAASYTFTMPSSAVTVEAVFEKGESERPVDDFRDVSESAWYYEAVDSVVSSGMMSGTSATTFAPNATLTRAMVVQTLWAAQDKPVVNYAMGFKDVAGSDWYAEAIRWAVSEQIVSGYSAEKFGPNDPVTREQLMTILYAYAKSEGKGFTGAWMMQLGYADKARISDWAYEAACWCTTNGVVSGKTGNLLDPQGTATRAEAAQMLVNFMKALED